MHEPVAAWLHTGHFAGLEQEGDVSRGVSRLLGSFRHSDVLVPDGCSGSKITDWKGAACRMVPAGRGV